jgi:hypothetical protein
MGRKRFYVNVGSGEISQLKYDNNEDFIIYATEEDAQLLRTKMDGMDHASFRSFFRSHVPIWSYHNDKANDDYDANLTEAFQMIYDLGDETTRAHINSMDVL